MIETFKSKDLRLFWETGKPRGINPNFAEKVWLFLTTLNFAESIDEIKSAGFGLHQLTGDRQGKWSGTVSRNWRITFYFENGDAFDVNFEDYHGR